jgi:hypothetical protein
MVRIMDYKFLKTGLKYVELSGLSTDSKPTEGLATGSVFLEVDTGDAYLYDEEGATWNKVGG